MAKIELHPDAYIGTGELLRRVPWSRTTLNRQVRAGHFPAPTKISSGRNAWRWGDVVDHFNSLRDEKRDAA